MLGGMSANKKLGGLHNLTITSATLPELEKAVEEAHKLGRTQFTFQHINLTTVYARYILKYYGEEGRKKRNLKYR